MLNYLICDFAKQTLANMVKLCFDSDYPHIYRKNQIEYIYNYLKDLDCNHIVLEPEYIDRDFLEDYASYYVKSFNNRGYKTARLHFFSKKINHRDIDKYLYDGIEDEHILEWKSSYLGFMVIKPMAEKFIGKTCLKPYSSFERKDSFLYKKSLYKEYKVNLFGIGLTVNSIAFQEQDTIVSACATTSLWSAFHALQWTDVKEIPSCSKITINAINHVEDSQNLFPQKELTAKQILRAIDIQSLKHHDLKLESMDYLSFHQVVKFHIDSNLPLILGLRVESIDKDGRTTYLGDHAVTVLGYKNAITENSPQCIYIHDNRLGPYVRASYFQKTDSNSKWGLIIQKKDEAGNWQEAHEIMYPSILISMTKQKVRLSYEMALNTMNMLYALFKNATSQLRNNVSVSFDIKLQEISEIRSNLLNDKFSSSSYSSFYQTLQEKRKVFLLKSYAKYHWVASITVNQEHSLDILFDATAIPQGNAIAGIIYRNYEHANIFLSIFEKFSKQKEDIEILAGRSKRSFLGAFLSFLQSQTSESLSYLDENYGELRAPVYLKEHEFHGGEIHVNITAKKFHGRVSDNLSMWVKDLEDNNPKSTTLWAICDDGSLVLGKEIDQHGHPTLTGFMPARIAGEIIMIDGKYFINSKSGRYSTDYRLTDKYLQNALGKFLEIFPDGHLIEKYIPSPKR
ncbi:hypothetical protein L8T04_16085 [Enterobacter cloacae]|uniref:hypothetical protein n=1 Tax=Enterobacter cloacae TaxID=550 RepID=UPI0020032947|nr:hypothetical protein [Enterobacter cloacae]MCK6721122.1 hypothetical protein [Enterobacter cloacae]